MRVRHRCEQAMNSCFFVPNRRNRYACEIPARLAIASVEVPCSPPMANSLKAAASSSPRRSCAVLRARGAPVGWFIRRPPSLRQLAPDLHRDLLDRQGDRRLGLRGLDPDRLGTEVLDDPIGDDRAQALERLVVALLRDQRDELADLTVIDGVLDPIGLGGVGLADVDADVEQQPLSDLALGRADADVGVQGEPRDLDRDDGLHAGVEVELVVGVQFVVGLVVHRSLTVAAATSSASCTAPTSCTRNTLAPRSSAITFVAIVPARRSRSPTSAPRNDLREVPIRIGCPSTASSPRRSSSSRLCATVLPKPIPGSTTIRSRSIPAARATATRAARNSRTSPTTSS